MSDFKEDIAMEENEKKVDSVEEMKEYVTEALKRVQKEKHKDTVIAILTAADWTREMLEDPKNEQRLVAVLKEPFEYRDLYPMVTKDNATSLARFSVGIAGCLVDFSRKRALSESPLSALEERISKMPKKVMSKSLVKTSGYDFFYSDREYSFGKLSECLVSRFESWVAKDEDRNLHPIPFLADGPGTGKSRFLQELPVTFKQFVGNSSFSDDFKDCIGDARFINITFGNGYTYSDDEISIGMGKSLALRILHSFDDSCIFPKFLKTYSTVDVDLASVLENVGKGFSCVVLGIDEVNKVFETDKSQFKKLFNSVGGLSCSFQPFFVPILAGTVIGPIREIVSESTHPPCHIPLPLLTYESCLNIMSRKNSSFTDGVESDQYLRILISDVGGHCRALEILYDVLMKHYNPTRGNNWEFISFEVHSSIRTRYPILAKIPLGGAIAYSFLSIPVVEHDPLPDYPQLSFLELSEYGIVQLEHIGYFRNRVRIPYVFVCCHLLSTKEIPYSIFWRELLLTRDFWWQDWEKFNQNYIAFRLSLYSYLGYSKVPLSQFLSGAKLKFLADKTLAVPAFGEIHTYKIDFRFPLTKQPEFADGDCILNADGAPFDAFVFLTADSGRILIAQQMKFSQQVSKKPKKINNRLINTEYSKVKNSLEQCTQGIDFVLLLCGRSEGAFDISSLPCNVAIVSISEFELFYGKSYYNRLCIL